MSSPYATAEETAALVRPTTTNESWLHEQLDRIDPSRHEMGSAGDTPALVKLVFELKSKLEAVKPANGPGPDGWRLVPIEPTMDMYVAGDEVFASALKDECTATGTTYRAMLAAAPPPPEQSAKPLPPKWISVSDRPPLEGQMVLAWFYGFAFSDTAVWSSGRWALDEEFDRDYDPVKNPITHWMHLPEAPTNGIQGEST